MEAASHMVSGASPEVTSFSTSTKIPPIPHKITCPKRSSYLAPRKSSMPLAISAINTEEIADPKAELLQLVKRCRVRKIKEDILPKNEFAAVGPNYNGRLGEFVMNHWNIDRAMQRSDSLKRAVIHLSTFNVIYK